MAQFKLAKMLAEGDGVPKDLAAAKEWMQKSAGRGYERAKTWIANWEVATAFDESGNRPPQLTSVTYIGDERPTSISYSADKMTYKDGKLVTGGDRQEPPQLCGANSTFELKISTQRRFDISLHKYRQIPRKPQSAAREVLPNFMPPAKKQCLPYVSRKFTADNSPFR